MSSTPRNGRASKTYEARRIVVTDRLGVAVSLEHRVGLNYGVLQRSLKYRLLFATFTGRRAHKQRICTDDQVKCQQHTDTQPANLLYTVYMIQSVVKPVVSCKHDHVSCNKRLDNRLYRVNGVLQITPARITAIEPE